jgi:hypothetical protein
MTRTDIPGLPYLEAYRKKLLVELSFLYVGCTSTSHCVVYDTEFMVLANGFVGLIDIIQQAMCNM